MNLEGKVIVVIGASSGIGEGITRAIAEKNPLAIVLAARREELLREIASSLSCETFVQKTNVNDDESVRYLLEQTHKKYQRIDAVVNSAGVMKKGSIEDMSVEDIDLVLNTNLRQAIIVGKYIAPIFKQQGNGIYLVISSQAGKIAFAGETAYCASKGGVDHFMRSLSEEWSPQKDEERKLYAFAIGPGFINTAEVKEQYPNFAAKIEARAPKPTEFGRIVIEYLASPKLKYSEGGAVHYIDTLRI